MPKAILHLTKEQIISLFMEIGYKKNQLSFSEDWINSICPLAFLNHQKGKDTNPSFGIRIGAKPFYKCFTCGNGGLGILLSTLYNNNKITYTIYEKWAEIMRPTYVEEAAFNFEFNLTPEIIEPDIILPDWVLNKFFPVPRHPYLQERNVTEQVAVNCEIMYDPIENRIGLPVRNFKNNLTGFVGRTLIGDPNKYKNYKFVPKQTNNTWVGENRCDFDYPLIIVEGIFDFLRLKKFTNNVLVALTSKPKYDKLKRIKWAIKVYGGLDNDVAGNTGWERIVDFFGTKAIRLHFTYGDIGEMPDDAIMELLQNIGDIPWQNPS